MTAPNRRARARRWIYDRLPRWLKTNDFELFAAILSIMGGAPLVVGQVQPSSVEALLPDLAVRVWGWVLVIGGVLVIVGVVRSSHLTYPRKALWLRVEALGLSMLAWFCYIYVVCILGVIPASGWTAAMIALAFGMVCHVRNFAIHTKLEDYRVNLGLEGKA